MMLPIAKYAQKRKTGMFGFFLKNPRKILFILILAVLVHMYFSSQEQIQKWLKIKEKQENFKKLCHF
jgi:hypothetical protein